VGLIYRVPQKPDWPADAEHTSASSGFNKLFHKVQAAFSEVFTLSMVWRAGKVYTYAFGPFDEDTNQWIRSKFLTVDCRHTFHEGQLHFVCRPDEKTNLIHDIRAAQTPDSRHVLLVKLDVNNTDLTHAMGPTEIRDVFSRASEYAEKDFWQVFAD
jgi:hypothetical protein